ncbi:metallophosphoesterase [Isoptericola sp. b490]|uniref:metallophosphoesterase family protein n=1 Tax=Actinotalea lenta TaxID=3064654 RepID=UPI0027130433|nr:metallophosphoesterase [Isoptericola sp. b490]MDO8120195.1 metallophosphoesterase [Isoptericola sp. b490]
MKDDELPDQVPEVSRPPRRLSRALSWAGVVLIAVLGALVFGVTTAQADGTLGPHLARYEMTVDHEITVDLGPLGTVVIDSPLPATLGARVVVEEIPAELTTLDGPATLDSLSGDLQRYVQFFTAPQATIEAAARALALDAARRAAIALLAAAAAGELVRWLLGARRRAELWASVRRHRGLLAGGTALAVLVIGTVTASGQRPPSPESDGIPSAVFNGTPLQGARITGRLAGLVDTYGAQAIQAYRQNEAFYATAADNVEKAWDAKMQRERAAAVLMPSPPGPANTITALVVSDLHCNVGMAGVITRVARLADVDMVLNAGDSTVDGTAVEAYCVQTFAHAVPSGVPYVISDGNHDSAKTAQEERAVGATVLSGRVVTVDGIRILGDSDPNKTRIGEGTSLASDETASQEGHRLADVACEDGDVDLLLIHTPWVGDEALQRGCVPAQISGHLHTRYGPTRVGAGVRYISSSTAGAKLNEPTIGPLNGTAELTVLTFDADTHRILYHRLVQVRPSGEALVGPRLAWPSGAPPEPLPQAPSGITVPF